MADRTSADICCRIVTLLDTYIGDVTPEAERVMREVVEMFYEYDFNMRQAFWSDEEMELAKKWGICLICDKMDCEFGEEEH